MTTFRRFPVPSPLRPFAFDFSRTAPLHGLAAGIASAPRATVRAYRFGYALWRALDLGAMRSQNCVEINKTVNSIV